MSTAAIERVHCQVAHTLLLALIERTIEDGRISNDLAAMVKEGSKIPRHHTAGNCEKVLEFSFRLVAEANSACAATHLVAAEHYFRLQYYTQATQACVSAISAAFGESDCTVLLQLCAAIGLSAPQDPEAEVSP